MKLKAKPGDFRVRELLADGYVGERGDFAVYRVTKRKLTTPEAVRILSAEAGVEAAAVGVAGLKDRQATTTQHMSVAGGRAVRVRTPQLIIEPVGRAMSEVTSAVSTGNAFELVVRDLSAEDVQLLRENVPLAREQGVVNYFDDQRFGNVEHGQGWIARELMRGDVEGALRTLLTARSPHDDGRRKRFKERVDAAWGDWRECRDEAGRFGQHHSVFEHLAKNPDDFAGAFGLVAGRLRLIHLYAYQSHLWNRAGCELVRRMTPPKERITLESREGPLVTFAGARPPELAQRATLRLPGDGLEDVTDPLERELFESALRSEEMDAARFRIEGIPGFQLKGEDRALFVVPRHLRVRPPEPDSLHPRAKLVRIRFELPRGAYATLVIKRLFAGPRGERAKPQAQGRERRGYGQRGSPKRDQDKRYSARRDRDERVQSERGQSERSQGKRSHGERGDRSHGERSHGKRGHGERRSYGERSYGERSHSGERGKHGGERGRGTRDRGSDGHQSGSRGPRRRSDGGRPRRRDER